MDIKADGAVYVRVERIPTSVKISGLEFFGRVMAVKLAEKHYRKDFSVLRGADFEGNMLLFFAGERKLLDDYTRIKIGRARLTPEAEEYARKVAEAIPRKILDRLLHLCRFCSYAAGGPGFPDLILIGKSDGGYSIKYVHCEELEASQKLFLLLARAMDIDAGVAELAELDETNKLDEVNEGGQAAFALNPRDVARSILNESRARQFAELEIDIENEKSNIDGTGDEMEYLEREKNLLPFGILRKLSDTGISAKDLKGHMEYAAASSNEEIERFQGWQSELLADSEYQRYTRSKLDAAMLEKMRIIQARFGLGPSRAKAFLRFMES